jgi:predicted DNA-binding transcriptional regulator AlpA
MSLPTHGRIRMHKLLELDITGMKRTKLLKEIEAGRFPKPRRDSFRCVTFDCGEIHEWLAKQRDSSAAPSAPAKAPPRPPLQRKAATLAAVPA